MTIGIAIILLAGIGILTLWKLSPADREKSRWRNAAKKIDAMWNKSLSLQSYSKFTICGKIFDDTGQPVDQVKVLITKGYFINLGESRYEDSSQTVNSDFKLALSGGSNVSLLFHKEGYYSEKVNFSLPLSKNTLIFSSNIVVADKQKIVLERTGTMAKYKDKSPALFIKNERTFTYYSVPLLKCTEKEYSFTDVSNLQSGIIYPDIERDKDGKIVKVVIDKVTERMGPRTVTLNMVGGDNDGFIMLEEPPPNGMTSIKEAPEAGYVKQMVFHWPEDMKKIFYFYYKFGNSYGKGVANSFSCTASGEIMIGLELAQNIETSTDPQVHRNLRTRDIY